jgi:hypothetical protein
VIATGVTDTNGNGRINDEVRAIMESTADDVNSATYPGWDIYIGNGRVDAYGATVGE